ncbi:MAG TPA: hypothetical protein VHE60_01605 [Pyrinomonadaceae bacterium]|nr:hypothetical protein [Pyrinomonadaceae bacterium]
MDQVYQIQAIMEATGAVKDAPVIRELLDEALGARRRKALGITDSEEPPGQGTAATLHTLQTMLLKLIKRDETNRLNQHLGLKMLRETLIEARAGREVYFEDIVEGPWLEKGKTRETMENYFELKTRHATKHVDDVIEKIQKEEAGRRNS